MNFEASLVYGVTDPGLKYGNVLNSEALDEDTPPIISDLYPITSH